MATRCLNRACPWELATGELFCGLCGTRAATCDFDPPHVRQGLVFYPDEAHGTERAFKLRNAGSVEVEVRLRTSPGYRLALGSLPALGDVTTRLNPGEARGVVVRPREGLPGRDEWLEVISPVVDPAGVRIPLIASPTPRWALRRADRLLHTGEGPAVDLYPPSATPTPQAGLAGERWRLSLGLTEGAAVVDAIVLGEGTRHLQLHSPSGRHLLQSGDRLTLTLDWVLPPAEPVEASIEVLTGLLPAARFPLRVHPQPPVSLRPRLLAAEDGPLFVGEGVARVSVALHNDGARPARLAALRVRTEHVRLAEVRLSDTAWDCRGLATLPRAVEAAWLPGPQPRAADLDVRIGPANAKPAPPAQVLALVFEVGAEAAPVDGVLHLDLAVDVAAGGAVETVPLALGVPARRVRTLQAHEGHALIDFGTVHTCVRLVIDDPAVGTAPEGLVQLDPTLEDEAAGMLKSAFRVHDWAGAAESGRDPRATDGPRAAANASGMDARGAPDLRFGHHVWEEIPHFVGQTDFAAKLRLGTDLQRPLRDRHGELRLVSGAESAAHLLGEVLRQISRRTGFRPRSLWFTRPAAFDARADADLVAALRRLGQPDDAISLRCSEPEAYLCSLASDAAFRARLDTRLEAASRPLLGFVFDFGGGTTDVTLFEVHPGRVKCIEIVASHGYRWLGGESLTLRLAGHLYRTITDRDRYPFPKALSGTDADADAFLLESLDPHDVPLQRNLAVMRALAERIKCDAEYFDNGNQVVSETLMDRHGAFHPVEVRVEAGADAGEVPAEGAGASGVVPTLQAPIARALDDVLERVTRMRAARHLATGVPQVVAVAGNAGRLWCLEAIVRQRLAEAGAEDVLYHFDKRIAKSGVVDGLSVFGRSATRVGIVARRADPHWWYVQVGTRWQLVRPAGAPLADPPPNAATLEAPPVPSPPPDLRPALDAPVQIWGHLDLFVGPGPAAELDGAGGGRLRRSHTVDPGDLRGALVDVALGFDAADRPGLWLRALRPGRDDGPWTWFRGVPLGAGEDAVGT